MANYNPRQENLIKNSQRSRQELQAMGRKGGLKTAENRKRQGPVKVITVINDNADRFTVKFREYRLAVEVLHQLVKEYEHELIAMIETNDKDLFVP